MGVLVIFIIICLGVFCLHVYLGMMLIPGAPEAEEGAVSLFYWMVVMVVNCHGVLGMEPWSFGRAASSFNC